MKTALCIGINTYPGTENDLQGCVNDAHDWATKLSSLGYAPTLLLDRQATGTNIRDLVRSLLANARRGDHAVITYSGHGSYVPDVNGDEPDGVDECWCASDIASHESGYLTDDELSTMLQQRAANVRCAVISDSCHSGTMTRMFPLSAVTQRRRIKYIAPKDFLPAAQFARLRAGRAFARVSKAYPAVLVAGCQDTEYSYDGWFGDRANGVFTRAALDTFKPGMSYRAWRSAIGRILPSRDYPQTPNLSAGWWQGCWKALA